MKQGEVIKIGTSLIAHELELRGHRISKKLSKLRNSFELFIGNSNTPYSLRIRTLAKKNPVPMGRSLDNYKEDFLIACRNIENDPEFYVFKMSDAIEHTTMKNKNGVESYWIEPPDLMRYRDNWGVL